MATCVCVPAPPRAVVPQQTLHLNLWNKALCDQSKINIKFVPSYVTTCILQILGPTKELNPLVALKCALYPKTLPAFVLKALCKQKLEGTKPWTVCVTGVKSCAICSFDAAIFSARTMADVSWISKAATHCMARNVVWRHLTLAAQQSRISAFN